jgi:hypothetical protein
MESLHSLVISVLVCASEKTTAAKEFCANLCFQLANRAFRAFLAY